MKTTLIFILCLLSQYTEKQHQITFPKLDVNISFLSSNNFKFKSTKEIVLHIKLKNNTTQNQKFLFDRPKISTGGTWQTTVSVVNANTNRSQLKYQNKEMLSSQLYSEKELAKYYYNLKPRETLERNYSLCDLVVFKNESLTPGKYILRLTFNGNISNRIIFDIVNSGSQ